MSGKMTSRLHPRGLDRYEPIKRLALVQIHPPRNPNKPLTPFGITDILSRTSQRPEHAAPQYERIVRPWADSPPPESCSGSDADDEEEEIDVDDSKPPKARRPEVSSSSQSPLDALLQMTNKTFQGLETQNQGAEE